MDRLTTSVSAKSLLTSKTFWFNVIVLVVTVADFVPQKYGIPAAAIGNVILRLMTNQPCSVFPTTTKKE